MPNMEMVNIIDKKKYIGENIFTCSRYFVYLVFNFNV